MQHLRPPAQYQPQESQPRQQPAQAAQPNSQCPNSAAPSTSNSQRSPAPFALTPPSTAPSVSGTVPASRTTAPVSSRTVGNAAHMSWFGPAKPQPQRPHSTATAFRPPPRPLNGNGSPAVDTSANAANYMHARVKIANNQQASTPDSGFRKRMLAVAAAARRADLPDLPTSGGETSSELTYEKAMESLARSLGTAQTNTKANAPAMTIPASIVSQMQQSKNGANNGHGSVGSSPIAQSNPTSIANRAVQPSAQPRTQQTNINPDIAHYLSFVLSQQNSSSNQASRCSIQSSENAPVSQGVHLPSQLTSTPSIAQVSAPAPIASSGQQVSSPVAQSPPNPLAIEGAQSPAQEHAPPTSQFSAPPQANSTTGQASSASTQRVATPSVNQGTQQQVDATPSVVPVSSSSVQQRSSSVATQTHHPRKESVVKQYVEQHRRPATQAKENPATSQTAQMAMHPEIALPTNPGIQLTLQSGSSLSVEQPPAEPNGINGNTDSTPTTFLDSASSPAAAAAAEANKRAVPATSSHLANIESQRRSSPLTQPPNISAPPNPNPDATSAGTPQQESSTAAPQVETPATASKPSSASATAAAAAAAWNRRLYPPLDSQLFASPSSENATLTVPKSVGMEDRGEGMDSEDSSSEESNGDDGETNAGGGKMAGIEEDSTSKNAQAAGDLVVPSTDPSPAPGPSPTTSTGSRSRRSDNGTAVSTSLKPSKLPGPGTKPWKYHALVEEELIDGVWKQVGEVEGTHVSPSARSATNLPRSASQDVDGRSERGEFEFRSVEGRAHECVQQGHNAPRAVVQSEAVDAVAVPRRAIMMPTHCGATLQTWSSPDIRKRLKLYWKLTLDPITGKGFKSDPRIITRCFV